jgi:hypothetical protein
MVVGCGIMITTEGVFRTQRFAFLVFSTPLGCASLAITIICT